MLFSALVDADYLATEAQFEGDLTGMRYRERSPSLDSEEIMKKLLDYKNKIEINSTASVEINCLRKDLFDACCIAAESPKESPLTQGRELKHIIGVRLGFIAFVAPHAGAWIETFYI